MYANVIEITRIGRGFPSGNRGHGKRTDDPAERPVSPDQ
jgi:hypothetical protein